MNICEDSDSEDQAVCEDLLYEKGNNWHTPNAMAPGYLLAVRSASGPASIEKRRAWREVLGVTETLEVVRTLTEDNETAS